MTETHHHGYLHRKDDVQARLKRIEGQARGLQRMVDEEQYCIDILTQVSAMTKALQAVAMGLLEAHISHCVVDAAIAGGPQADAKIKEVMIKKGLVAKSGLSASMCPVTTGDGSVTIDTQGLIFKCNAMLGHPELAIGSISEESYNDRHHEFMAADAWKKCDADCPYVPLCNTGCRLFSFSRAEIFRPKAVREVIWTGSCPKRSRRNIRTSWPHGRSRKPPPKRCWSSLSLLY